MADLSGLLDEISADNPCGDNLEYDNARVALDTDILGTPENQFSGEKAMPPNWRQVQKDALALLGRSKDLQVALYLIRCLIPTEGVRGFRDGLNLLTEWIDRYWEHLHPQLDPDDGLDPTLRINIIEELNNFDWVLRPLSQTMLVESKSVGRFCLRDMQYATDKLDLPAGQTKPEISAINAAFLDVELEELAANFQAINDSMALLDRLDAAVVDRVGNSQAASLSAAKALFKEIRHFFEQFAGSRLADQAEPESDVAEEDVADAGETVRVSAKPKAGVGEIATRQDVLKSLDLICKYYAENEPSSPVPILLLRAKHLVTADFREIVLNLMPDALTHIDALKGPDPH
ncbi:type VI secretion system protein TssA [Methylomonas sp. MED-D]|uniref:type VI secretion system protein TssA n=1 Tax=unclassified Methylomonas TaxID=2608980 RepID=UPI00247A47E3|nr:MULTISPECIES: type VI secretion system protein TssA [unclassified Methylomonas]MDT4330345.1 type VI secretion system protein TssA [Methylomonas sp. MV1]WGS86515.1 type VI secretion system protein TssA [Methylomonas sp. UP202]